MSFLHYLAMIFGIFLPSCYRVTNGQSIRFLGSYFSDVWSSVLSGADGNLLKCKLYMARSSCSNSLLSFRSESASSIPPKHQLIRQWLGGAKANVNGFWWWKFLCDPSPCMPQSLIQDETALSCPTIRFFYVTTPVGTTTAGWCANSDCNQTKPIKGAI